MDNIPLPEPPQPDPEGEGGAQTKARFGTFTGVFTPTLLTILGVIMYVRLGWVVGNAGLIGAWLIMFVAMGITAATGLALSSIATNTRMGAGGPYALISRSLGVEVGGSIGVPLYLSRPLGVAMYIFGFREGWQWFFPEHPALAIDLSVFVVLFALAYISANMAFRVQYLIMGVIAVSLVSIFAAPAMFENPIEPTLWGDFPGFKEDGFGGADFWLVFAIFFPATTGILAGANMSGELKDPRRSIPRGTLWAIGLSSLIYFVFAYYAASLGTPDQLVDNYNVLIDEAFWPPAVLAGLLGATFSSALASAVGGPRILMAMGQDRLLPWSGWLSSVKGGEPRHAIAVTAVLSFAALMMRDLNLIAPLVTMFFLITYFFINVIVIIESGLGLVSFRPTLRIPLLIPILGAVGCVFVMFIISPVFGLVSVCLVLVIYVLLMRRGVESDVDDVRSGVFGALAEWAAAKVTELGTANVRAWKPNLMIPVEDPDDLRGSFRLVLDLCLPEGSVKLLGLSDAQNGSTIKPELQKLTDDFRKKGLFSTWSVIESAGFTAGVVHGLQALQSAFFRPNMLLLRTPDFEDRFEEFGQVIVQSHKTGVGVLLVALHPKVGLGQCRVVNLWVRPARGEGWDTRAAFSANNLNLTVLMGYRLMTQWKADLNLITVVPDESQREEAETFVRDIREQARLPKTTETHVLVGGFEQAVTDAPQSDMDVFGLQADPDFEFVSRMVRLSRSSCLFVADSGRESALA